MIPRSAGIEPLLPRNQPGVQREDDRRILKGVMRVLAADCRRRDCRRSMVRGRRSTTAFIAGRAAVCGGLCQAPAAIGPDDIELRRRRSAARAASRDARSTPISKAAGPSRSRAPSPARPATPAGDFIGRSRPVRIDTPLPGAARRASRRCWAHFASFARGTAGFAVHATPAPVEVARAGRHSTA